MQPQLPQPGAGVCQNRVVDPSGVEWEEMAELSPPLLRHSQVGKKSHFSVVVPIAWHHVG